MLARNRIAIVVVGAGIAVGTAYGIGTSDRVVARVLAAELAAHVRAPCRFEKASFTFLGGVEVKGLVILDPADPFGPPLVAAERCRVDYVLDVAGFGPHVTSIEIDRPRVRLERRADGSIPIEDAFELPRPQGPAPPRWPWRLRGGTVTFSDPTLLSGEPLALRDLDVAVTPATPRTTEWAGAVIRLTATADVFGALSARVVVGGADAPGTVTLDLPEVLIDPSVPRRFAGGAAKRIGEMMPTGAVTAHVEARAVEGKVIAENVVVDVRDVSLRATLPESAPGAPEPRPIEVTGLGGRLCLAGGRLEATDLVFRALGAAFTIDGTVEGVTETAPRLDARAAVAGLPVTRELRAFLPVAARRIAEAYDVTGTVDATAAARGPLSSFGVTADATIREGHASYAGYAAGDGARRGFPWDADDVTGRMGFDGRAIRIEATARHGPARVRVTGVVDERPGGASVPDVTIVAEDVPLDDDLRRGFGDRAGLVFDRWGPSGLANRITVHVFRDEAIDGDEDVTDVTIDCDGRAGFVPHLLPVPLSGTAGRIEIVNPVVDGRREDLVRLTGIAAKAAGFTLTVSGDVLGDGATAREDLRVGIDADDAAGGFHKAAMASPAVPEGVKDALRKLRPAGPVGIDAHLVKDAGQTRRDDAAITLRGTSVEGWDDVPLAARGLTGRVLVGGDVLTFEDVAGSFVVQEFSPEFTARGRLLGISGTPQFDVHVESPEIPLGEALRASLGPLAEKARAFWDDVRAESSARAAMVLDLRPDGDANGSPAPFEITLSGIRGALRPLGLDLGNDGGTFHYDGRRAEVRGLESSVGAASVRFDEAVYDVATRRVEIRASVRGLRFPEDLEGPLSAATVAAIVEKAPGRTLHADDVRIVYEADPPALEIAGILHVRPRVRREVPDPGYAPEGSLAVERLVFWMPEGGPVWFQGEAHASNFAVRAGLAVDKLAGPLVFSGSFGDPPKLTLTAAGATLRVEEYPFTEAGVSLTLKPRGARVDVTADFMGGAFSGFVGPGREGTGYHGSFHLRDADLERFLRLRSDPDKEVATGTVDADVEFRNETGARADLRGSGGITARDGRLMQAPGVGEVMRFLTLGAYTPVLTDGRVEFDLEGDWLNVKDVEVTGSGVNVSIDGGEGKIGLDGRLDMAVYPRIDLALPIIDQIWHMIQPAWLRRMRVTGTLRNPKINWEPVPTGDADRRREPQPAGDVSAPEQGPW